MGQLFVLGLHKDNWHDTGAAVVCADASGIRQISHINEERLNRSKHSRAFPRKAVAACFEKASVKDIDEIDLVVLDYTIDSEDWRKDYRTNPCETDVFLKLVPSNKIKIIRHHLCHAAATFYSSPFDEAAILIVDGRGSLLDAKSQAFETQTLWHGCHSTITLLGESTCIGIGVLYEAITKYLGFGFLEAGKTMGLAPFGKHDHSPLVDLRGSFEGLATDYSHLCDIDSALLTPFPLEISLAERCHIAYDVQSECERAILHLARHAKTRTKLANLCLGGGVALNGVANGKLIRENLFQDVFINPACSDSGIAFGAALWGYHNHFGSPRNLDSVSPYTGPRYSHSRVASAVAATRHKLDQEDILKKVITLLLRNKAVGFFHGSSEMGPRALGNRSILMSPEQSANRDHLNNIVKRREPFRPFAPCVPLEVAAQYFDLRVPSPFMLIVSDVRDVWRSRLGAVTHVDGTARVQTVTRQDHPLLHELLHAFGEASGVPVLLNTSFNMAGEPLVESPEDAVSCFERSALDALWIEGYLVTRND